MDDHRSADALTDALGRELEAALAVDPSPEFVARVRMRVQRERDASSPWPWRIAAAVAFVAIIAFVVGTSRQDGARVVQDASRARRQPTVAPGSQDIGPAPVAQDSTAGQAFKPAPTTAFRKSAAGRSRPALAARDGSLAAFDGATPDFHHGLVAVGEPELLIAADEARALRQLFSNVRKGRIDLSSLQEGAPATAALPPPSDIAFSPITFEPIAPEAVEEGERQ